MTNVEWCVGGQNNREKGGHARWFCFYYYGQPENYLRKKFVDDKGNVVFLNTRTEAKELADKLNRIQKGEES